MTKPEILAAIDSNSASLKAEARKVQDAQLQMTKIREERARLDSDLQGIVNAARMAGNGEFSA